jgi:Rrf2 family protein
MNLSKRGEYALRSLIALGVARETGRDLVRLGELAQSEEIPENFLQQIFIELRAAGLVESERGKNGGYRLGKPAGEIIIGDVVRLIDGPLAPIRCVSQTAYAKCSCPDEATCGLRLVMLSVRNSISGILDRFTLADIVATTVHHLRSRAPTEGRNPARTISDTRKPWFEEFLYGEGI